MKRYIRSQEDIFAMSKISSKYAVPDVKQNIDNFVYFSECNSSHGPRIKFYGGTKETSTTKEAPTLAFDVDGNCEVELADWMNKKNCPNAFNDDCINKLSDLINRYLPVFLLVWFKHLDEADALAYFHGQISLYDLIDSTDLGLTEVLSKDFTLEDVDKICRTYNYYKF